MCNINLVMNKNGLDKYEVKELMNVMSFTSFRRNDDGEGYIGITDKKMIKGRSFNKIIYKKNFSMLMTHQRYTTSGQGKVNVHPHESKDFLLMHNGIFSGLGTDKKSDSKVYLQKLQTDFNKTKNVIQSIKNVNKTTKGSYSIFLFHKKNNQFYYFKESGTSMFLLEDENWFIMSTDKDNIEYAQHYFDISDDFKRVTSNVIYKLTTRLEEVDIFKDAYNYYSWDNQSFKGELPKKKKLKSGTILERDVDRLQELYECGYMDAREEKIFEEHFLA